MKTKFLLTMALTFFALSPNADAQNTTHDSIELNGFGTKVQFDRDEDGGDDFAFFRGDGVLGDILDFDSPTEFSILRLIDGAEEETLTVGPGGVGVGTSEAVAPLYILNDESSKFGNPSALMILEDKNPTVSVRNLLTLVNNGGARFALQNSNTGKRWVVSTTNSDTLFWTESNSADPATAPFFRMFLNSSAHNILAQMGQLGADENAFDLRTNGNLTIAGALTEGSDRNIKKDFQAVNCDDVLRKVVELPLTTWTYKKDSDDIRHMGPMAQDFRAAFGLGVNDVTISSMDRNGVSLASIKALHNMVSEKTGEVDRLNSELERQAELLAEQANRLEHIEATLAAMSEQN